MSQENPMSIIERSGYRFSVEHEPDYDHIAPWEDYDGHGLISNWTTRDKAPGERVLVTDGRLCRYYDFAGTLALAQKDEWGCPHSAKHTTHRQEIACAVEADFEYLRRWCHDEWWYVGVVVTLLDDDDNLTNERESLWGIESDADNYLDEVADELADQIVSRLEVENPDVQLSEN